MKIAIIAHNLYPIAEPFAGGLEMVTFLLCRSLVERGHEIDLYAHPDSDKRFRIIPIKSNADFPRSIVSVSNPVSDSSGESFESASYVAVMNRIRDQNYDVVHNHSLHHVPIRMGNELECPFITSIHTPVFPHLRRGMSDIQGSCKQLFTMVSHSLATTWKSLAKETVVIYNGIDLDKWTYRARNDQDYLFWYGRICPEKGTHLAIKAALKSGKNLILAGPISNTVYFEDFVKPYLVNATVTYLGHRSQVELMPFLSNAGALLFTSVWEEPYGLTLAESLACGTPVVAFDGGATREILTESTGCTVPMNDLTEFVKAIPRTLELSREACRMRATEFCSKEVMVDNYIDLYRKLKAGNTIGLKRAV